MYARSTFCSLCSIANDNQHYVTTETRSLYITESLLYDVDGMAWWGGQEADETNDDVPHT